jgi:hypothetical protein
MNDPPVECRRAESDDSRSLDSHLALLTDERRRCVLRCLREASAPVALADLTSMVAEMESEHSSPNPPDHLDAVHHSLYHVHVPKLADMDVVEHDRDRNTVEPAANVEWVTELWSSLSDVDDPPPE